jgi:hypothetical protein
VTIAVERGRTPGWKQPGDLDRLAYTQGSLFYTFANFYSFQLDTWKNATLTIAAADGKTADPMPAIEMTFELKEQADFGLLRPPAQLMVNATDAIINAYTGVPVITGPFTNLQ